MRVLNAMLWQAVIVLGLAYFKMYYAACFAGGWITCYWMTLIVFAIAISKHRTGDE